MINSHNTGTSELRVSTWIQVVGLLLSEIAGTGILNLPLAFSKLGWITGFTMVGVFALMTTGPAWFLCHFETDIAVG